MSLCLDKSNRKLKLKSLFDVLDDIFPKVIGNIIEYYKLEPDSQVYINMDKVMKEYRSSYCESEFGEKFILLKGKYTSYNYRSLLFYGNSFIMNKYDI